MSVSHAHRSTQTPSDKLEDQAASAALHSHRDSPSTSRGRGSSILDADGRLSSASAAQSLKYARAQDLPSFPSTGGVKLASAGAAASLAESNKKSFEHWQPGDIPNANKAAEKATDYKMDDLWQHETSREGSKAAMIAHRDAAPVEIWRAPTSEQGASAATSALQNPNPPPAITERDVSGDNRHKALLAATASIRGGRKRAESAPMQPQQPASPHAGWALKAATSSHNTKPPGSPTPTSSSGMSSNDAARIQNMARSNVNRQMYTSNPPVSIEVEERRKQDTLRASAVAMAKKMYAIQQTHLDEARGIHRSESHLAAHTARRRAQSDAANKPIQPEEPPRYENLEESARRLAQERLSKIHDEHAEYRQYYGTNNPPQRSRTMLDRVGRGRPRRQDNIPEDDDDSDVEESRKIRQQMSLFQGKLAEVDGKKRQADRDALLAAAHKNVTARLNAMDEEVFSSTGKTSPHQRELWERQARERAQRESDSRMINAGKVHIGGGKYLEQEEIDAIARARLQPTLDEISKKAEEQRARDEELRLEQERIKAEQEAEKKRQAEIKAEQKAVVDREKAEQKAARTEEKRVETEKKHEERRVRNEQKASEKKARDEAEAARRAENPEAAKSRFGFFRSGAGAGAGAVAGTGAAAATEGTSNLADAAAGTTAAEPIDVEGDTVHDKVTLDPEQAAHAVAAEEDDGGLPQTMKDELINPASATEEAHDADDVGPKETVDQETTGPETALAAAPLTTSLPQDSTSPQSPTSPSKRDSKVKSFFKKLRGTSNSQNEYKPEQAPVTTTEPKSDLVAAMDPTEPTKDDDLRKSDSMRDVALAGRSDNETDDMYGGSAEPDGRVSPVHDGEDTDIGPGPAITGQNRDVSPPSDAGSVEEEPYVMAADVASSRYSTEHTGSKRNSGYDQVAAIEDEDDEPRGRKGFRERFLKKVMPGKDKKQPGGPSSSGVGASTSSASAATPAQAAATVPHEPESAATLPSQQADEQEEDSPMQKKVQEPSTTSTEATNASTVTGATTPALTHAQTNNDDDDDFEEARDTFDEGRMATKVDSGSARIVDVNSPIGTNTASSTVGKPRASGESSSRFTEEL